MKISFKGKTLFEGIIRGTAITDAHYGIGRIIVTALSFIVELDENIAGIPTQLPVFSRTGQFFEGAFSTIIKKGDRVLINGKIMEKELKIWQKEAVLIIADNIYNENIKFGF